MNVVGTFYATHIFHFLNPFLIGIFIFVWVPSLLFRRNYKTLWCLSIALFLHLFLAEFYGSARIEGRLFFAIFVAIIPHFFGVLYFFILKKCKAILNKKTDKEGITK